MEVAERTQNGHWQVLWGMDGPVQEYEPDPRETLLVRCVFPDELLLRLGSTEDASTFGARDW
jgi:hypothetical protein